MENTRYHIPKIPNPYSSKKKTPPKAAVVNNASGTRPNRVSLDGSAQLTRHNSQSSTSSSTSVQIHSKNVSVAHASVARTSPMDSRRVDLLLNESNESRNSFVSEAADIDIEDFFRDDDIEEGPLAHHSCPGEPRRLYQNDSSVLSTNLNEPLHLKATCLENKKPRSLSLPKPAEENDSETPTTNKPHDSGSGHASLPSSNLKNVNEEGNQSSSTIDNSWENSKKRAEKGEGQPKKKRKRSIGGKKKKHEGKEQGDKQRKLTAFFDNAKQIRDTDEEEPVEATKREGNDIHPATLKEHSDADPSDEEDQGNNTMGGSQMGQMSQEEFQSGLALFYTQTLTQWCNDHHERADEDNAKPAPDAGVLRDDDDGEEEELDLSEKELGSTFLALSQDWDEDETRINEKSSSDHAGAIKSIQVDEDMDSYDYYPSVIDEHKRTYTKGDIWHCIFPTQKVYTIVGFKLKGCTTKKAICRENIRMSKTFLGYKSGESLDCYWIEKMGLEEVDLKNLKYKGSLPAWERPVYQWQKIGDATGIAEDERKLSLSARYGFAYTPKDEETEKKKVYQPPTVLDLFAGVGGMSCGLEQAGFHVTHAVEENDLAASFLQVNSPGEVNVYAECVRVFLDKVEQGCDGYPRKGDIRHIHASTPCQGFSKANREKDGGKNGLRNNMLVRTWAKAIRLIEPDTASFENVTGFLQPEHVEVYLKQMVAEVLIDLHYTVRVCVLNAANYGDPQSRWRVFIFASKMGIPLAREPEATHGRAGLAKIKTVRDAIKDLEKIQPMCGSGLVKLNDGTVVSNHSIDGTEKKSESEKIEPNEPAGTLYGSSTNKMVHYKAARGLTTRELARLQSFPDTFKFPSNRNVARKQIYNAVPVNLAFAVGRSLMECYDVQYDS